jgi:hypothetical protein
MAGELHAALGWERKYHITIFVGACFAHKTTCYTFFYQTPYISLIIAKYTKNIFISLVKPFQVY